MQATTGSSRERGRLFPLLLLCFFLSGATGLGFEVVWARAFSLFIGASTYAHTIVLATFMGGLALGNAIFGRIADRTPNPVRLYGLLELGVGFLCIAFPWLFDALTGVYLHLASSFGFGSEANLPLKLLLSVLSILLPTVLMGGTLPVLARALVTGFSDLGARIGQLYFINTGGAVMGCLLTGFALVPWLGLTVTTASLAAFNIAIGVLFLWLARQPSEAVAAPGSSSDRPAPVAYGRREARWALIVITASGAASMTYELVWTRLLSLVLGSSVHSFTLMLVTFVSGIAVGGLVASRLLREPERPGDPEPPDAVRLLAYAELGVFVSIVAMLPLYERLPFAFNVLSSLFDRTASGFYLYLAVKVLLCVALMLIPTVLIGMTLPLASRIAVRSSDRVGTGVGNAFSLNTLGTLVGASLTGLVLIPALGLQSTLEAALAASALLGLLLLRVAPGVTRGHLVRVAALATAVVIAYATLLPAWDQGMLHSGLFRRKDLVATDYDTLFEQRERMDVLFHEDGVDTSVAVLRHRETGVLYLKVNGKTDAGTGSDMTTQLWLGHLPMMLAEDPRQVMVIGLGSGITAGAVLRHPVEHVDQVEISPAVVRASALFADANHHIADDARYQLHVGDAKEFFKLDPDRRYDAIISEPSNPWISGVGNLFTREYFREARAHLNEGGLMVQWVHLYEMDDEVLRIILDTFGSVFPAVTLWQCNSADILVVGSNRPLSADLARITTRMARPEVAADLNREGLAESVSDPLQVLALQVVSDRMFREWFPGRPPLNTDDRPILEYEAPRAFFMGEEAKILRRIDERRRPAGHGDLLLSRLLRERPLTDAQLSLLREHHARRNSAYDAPLVQSLVAEELRRHPSDPDALKRVLVRGHPASARALLWGRLRSEGAMSTELLPSLASDEVERLDAETSVYGAPGPDGRALSGLVLAATRADPQEMAPTLDTAADVLLRRGEVQEAQAVLLRLRQLDTDAPRATADIDMAGVLFRLGLAAMATGNQKAAVEAFRAAIESNPHHWPALQALYRVAGPT